MVRFGLSKFLGNEMQSFFFFFQTKKISPNSVDLEDSTVELEINHGNKVFLSIDNKLTSF